MGYKKNNNNRLVATTNAAVCNGVLEATYLYIYKY